MNEAIILIGSNINPEQNLKESLHLLKQKVEITTYSNIWKTQSFGSEGPDFLNIAVQIRMKENMSELKNNILAEIEHKLKRKRTSDKNAPRTIDLDPILFNGQILDAELWNKVFIAVPVADIKPQLTNPGSKETLKTTAKKLKSPGNPELFVPPAGFFPS